MNDPLQIESAIRALESQRAILGEVAVEAALAALRAQLASLKKNSETTIRLAGERKLVTVMFADISGFTALSEKHDPEVVRALMNGCFDQLVPIVQEYEGTVDKFIGDEIMALFGAPKAHERHAELACSAALDMFEAIRKFNLSNGTELALHIGINTGLVIAGGIGSEGRQEYSVMGDAVNLAARLKDAATSGEIFVGSEVHALTNHFFEYHPLPPLRLKGKNELVRTFRLQGKKAIRGTSREGTLRSQLIGREIELQALTKLLFDLKSGKGSRISIIGEAGIGKSRLMTEIQNQIDKDTLWIEGRSLPYTRQRAYQPALEILSRLMNIPTGTDAEQLKVMLIADLTQTFGAEGYSWLPIFCRMMQLPLSEEEDISVRYLNANALREKVFSAFITYIAAKAQKTPLILVWEDLHWADPSSLALIEHTLSLCETCPLAMVLVFRPRKEERIWQVHEQSQEKFGEHYHAFQLEPLLSSDTATLVRNLIHVENLDPEVERIILEKAEGNPFFTEELLRSLLDNGMLYLEGKMIKTSENLDTLAIPGTLQGVIASRIDRLGDADKQTLQTASVLGRIFRETVLTELLSLVKNDAHLPPSLQRLVDREMLRQRQQEEAETHGYIFKHAVTHDVAYNSLLLADRKILHRLAGETIEKLASEDLSDSAESLAWHYERADQQEKAVYYLKLAAGYAKKVHSNEEAVELYRRAIKQAEELVQKDNAVQWRQMLSELLENQGDILKLTGQVEQARTVFAQVNEYLDEKNRIGSAISSARIQRKIGMSYQALTRFQIVSEHFHKANDILNQWTGDKPSEWWHEWIELSLEHMLAHYWVNKTTEMQELAQSLRSPIESFGNAAQKARFYQNLVAINFRLEAYLLSDETVNIAQKSVNTCLLSKDLQMISVTHFFLGFALLWNNKLEESIAVLNQSLELANQTGDVILKSRNLTYLAVVHRRLSNVGETEVYAHKSMNIAQQVGMFEYMGTASANFAWLAWKNKEYDKVETLGKQAFSYWEKLTESLSLAFSWTAAFPLAALFFMRGNLHKSIEYFEIMLVPGRKRLEPELEQRMKEVVALSKSSINNPQLHQEVKSVLEMAEQYRYL
jgi:class 3 adenylate cyclase/tetratricopeptide (TPR) repeat protein